MEAQMNDEVPLASEGLKCENVSSGFEKPSSLSQVVGSESLDAKIATPTPQKTFEPARNNQKEEAHELPENCRVLADFFNCMTTSVRLLALRKKRPTFEIISRQVEILSGRKFSMEHLSQIKHVVPEAVHLDKVLVHDIKTLCMKPDITVKLSFDVIEVQQDQSPFLTLQQLFMSRLLDMATKLPGACEIPKAELPEPFRQKSNRPNTDALPVASSTESQIPTSENELLSNSVLMSPSFNRRFSKKMDVEAQNKTPLIASQIPTSSSNHKYSIDQDTTSISEPAPVSIPVLAQQSSSATSTVRETTPSKVEVKAGDLMLQTPALLTPRRSVPSCDDKPKNMTTQSGTPYSAKRSLDFSAMEGSEKSANTTSDEIGSLIFGGQTSQQNISPQRLFLEEIISNSHKEKEEKDLQITQGCSINQTGLAYQKIPAGLSDLITLIHQTFQSVNCSSLTKDELIYKIMINIDDIVERREVEEQIGLLEKLVPDWICSKLVPSGDILYTVKKHADPNPVCRSVYKHVKKTSTEIVS